ICVAGACDWGPSVPLAVPHFIMAMRRRGHDDALIRRIVYENPVAFLGQSPKFRLGRTAAADVAGSGAAGSGAAGSDAAGSDAAEARPGAVASPR
ncbi:MAG TPA: hypothetical protein VIK91_04820, partial [Nannocystis sp.]